MKLLLSWLGDYCNGLGDPQTVATDITRFGLEVEKIDPLDGGDAVFETEVTSNRPDWNSFVGVARDLATARGAAFAMPDADLCETGEDVATLAEVETLDADLCPRYTARVIRGVKVGPSPEWLRKRLEAMGLRPINSVVDITNYVLFETGQPLHAFDYDKLAGRRIVVRRARKGETIVSIDGTECELDKDMLVIADAERPVAVAGVMGGMETEVSDATSTVLLESAYFKPASVKATSRKLDLFSDSSFRFERGVDPGLVEFASRRAAHLIQELAGGEVAAGVIDVNFQDLPPREVALRMARVERLLGQGMPIARAREILAGLGFEIVQEADDALTARVPTNRLHDVRLECDLVEELARIEGYDRITAPSRMPVMIGELPARLDLEAQLAGRLTAAGYYETVSISFVDGKETDRLSPWPSDMTIRVPKAVNKQEGHLRKTLAGNLLRTKQVNRHRGVARVRLFEIAKVFLPLETEKLPVEKTVLGLYDDEGFRRLKGAVAYVLEELQIEADEVKGCDLAAVDPERAVRYEKDGRLLGYVGEVSEPVRTQYDIAADGALAELDVDLLNELACRDKRYRKLPRFPGVEQDLALVVDEAAPWGDVAACVRRTGGALLESIAFFDEYRGKQVDKGKKSLAFSMTFRADDHTLTSEEVDVVRQKILAALAKEYGAELRK